MEAGQSLIEGIGPHLEGAVGIDLELVDHVFGAPQGHGLVDDGGVGCLGGHRSPESHVAIVSPKAKHTDS